LVGDPDATFTRRRMHNGIASIVGFMLASLPVIGMSMELMLTSPLNEQGRSRLSLKDNRRQRLWMDAESVVKNAPDLRIIAFPSPSIGIEYQHQNHSYLNTGRLGQQVCTFFGCVFAGTNLVTKTDVSEQLRLSLPTHTIFVNGLFSRIPVFGTVALGVGYINGEAQTFGTVENGEYRGAIPLLAFRVTNNIYRSDLWSTELNADSRFFYNKNGELSINSIAFNQFYNYSQTLKIGFKVEAISFRAEYRNINIDYRQRAISVNPSLFVLLQF